MSLVFWRPFNKQAVRPFIPGECVSLSAVCCIVLWMMMLVVVVVVAVVAAAFHRRFLETLKMVLVRVSKIPFFPSCAAIM